MEAKDQVQFQQFAEPGDRYQLGRCVGKGMFAKVFLATDREASNRKVAIKIQQLGEETRIYIEREYMILRDLSSNASLPDFYGIYRKDIEIWIVEELCEGGSISDLVNSYLQQNRRVSEEHIAHILKETVKAIVFLHEQCIIHRDIKARNILLTKEGEVKLADFGLSCFIKSNFDKTDSCVGAPSWMAPEIVQQKPYDNRVDVWALGITAIEIGDGKAPYELMHPTRALFQIVTNPPPGLSIPSSWSEDFVDFISECLVKNPEHRPYIAELMEHPFLSQIPDKNYHLTLEIKSLLNEGLQQDLQPEISISGKFMKRGVDGDMVEMFVEDLATLDNINEKKIMKELKARFANGEFQTYIGDVLLILNPNEKKEVYGSEFHRKFFNKSRSDNGPHIYSVAESAYQNALHHIIPQRIVLTGESGSGKTKNFLHLVDHLLFLGENSNINLQRLKTVTKIIHSMTHASTPINAYSTRSILKMNISFGSTGKVTGALFNVHQLEKMRISSVDMFQGNFHIFYYIFDGLRDAEKLQQYELDPNRNYRYLRLDEELREGSPNPKINPEQNTKKFKTILKLFEDFGLKENDIDNIFTIIAAILTLGEIRFESSNDNHAKIQNYEDIEKVAKLLEIDAKQLSWAFINYCVNKKGSIVRKKCTTGEARDARDVLANTLYSRFVDYIVSLINNKLLIGKQLFGEKYFVKIFDYSGFECFKQNHLPQLFINCLSEQLEYHYLQRIFAWELIDIKAEDLVFEPIPYYDNKTTLNLLLANSASLFHFLDESSRTGQNGKYVIDAIKTLEIPQIRSFSPSEFSVCHYSGKVIYDVTEMPYKNRDFLPPEIIETLRLSDNDLIRLLFSNKLNKTGNLIVPFDEHGNTKTVRKIPPKDKTQQYSQLKKLRTSSTIFRSTSLDILKELSIGGGSGGTHFVRCIRTDLKGRPVFNDQLVKQQIRAFKIAETAKSRQMGFPQRIPFAEFLRRYQFLAFEFNENVDVTKENCRLLLIRLKIEDGWSIGKSKVFLKYYVEEYLARLYEHQVKKIIKIQSILRGFLAKCRVAKKMQDKIETTVQAVVSTGDDEMTEEEAAAIIQKAYRLKTNFCKNYPTLDNESCDFIKPFAEKWKKDSIFHVLLRYRSQRIQDFFNFSQQVHLYNIDIFHELQRNTEPTPLDKIDSKANPNQWLGEAKLTVTKIPFRLCDIPFYDTSHLTAPSTTTESKTPIEGDFWDLPYRWRRPSDSKQLKEPDEDKLIYLTYNRNPEVPHKELPDSNKQEETNSPKKINKKTKDEENTAVRQTPYGNKCNVSSPHNDDDEDDDDINSNAKPANKDFTYIKSPGTHLKGRSVDPVAELRTLVRKSSLQSENDPPFNFQAMLRKTNYNKDIEVNKTAVEPKDELKMISLRKVKVDDGGGNTADCYYENGNEKVGRSVKVELAPDLCMEGIEVDL